MTHWYEYAVVIGGILTLGAPVALLIRQELSIRRYRKLSKTPYTDMLYGELMARENKKRMLAEKIRRAKLTKVERVLEGIE